MVKIIRRPDRAEGGITPEEKAKMDEYAQLWISRAMRTDPIEPDKIIPAIKRLYAVSGLKEPRVIIVPSPLVMAIAGVTAACVLEYGKNGFISSATFAATDAATDAATVAATVAATSAATDAATDAATVAATFAATDAATFAATDAATFAATDAATFAATDAATSAATDAATSAATDAATYAATRSATDAATSAATSAATVAATFAATFAATDAATFAATDAATVAATDAATVAATDAATGKPYGWVLPMIEFFVGRGNTATSVLNALPNWWRMYQGGNMWAGWASWLGAARDILGLRIPIHDKYAAWEDCATHGGFRIMHPDFCMVCDFPEVLTKDEQNRPHNDTGPSHRWRDGWSLYHIHGVRVDGWIVEHPERITVKHIEDEQNAEVRRILIDRYGADRYLLDSGAKPIAKDSCGILYHKEVPEDEPIVMVRVLNSTPEPDGTLTQAQALKTFHPDTPVVKDGENIPLRDAPKTNRYKAYMLRVPPDVTSPKQAVAWTFGIAAEDYEPVFES